MSSFHSISKFDLLKCYDDTAEECIVWVFVCIKISEIKEKFEKNKGLTLIYGTDKKDTLHALQFQCLRIKWEIANSKM